jgi:hypothetical protein
MRRELIGHLTKTNGQNSKPRSPIPVWYQPPRDNNRYNPDGTLRLNGILHELCKTEAGRTVLKEWTD